MAGAEYPLRWLSLPGIHAILEPFLSPMDKADSDLIGFWSSKSLEKAAHFLSDSLLCLRLGPMIKISGAPSFCASDEARQATVVLLPLCRLHSMSRRAGWSRSIPACHGSAGCPIHSSNNRDGSSLTDRRLAGVNVEHFESPCDCLPGSWKRFEAFKNCCFDLVPLLDGHERNPDRRAFLQLAFELAP
jgi:hypothetical protein